MYQKLKSNLHLITEQKDRNKTKVEVVFTSGGSYFENKADSGKKHLLEHCIASRTSDKNFQQFQDFQFQENIFVNAYTGPLTMGVEVSGYKADFNKILDLTLEMALSPTFDQEILNQEREIVLREISERRGDPSYQLHFLVAGEIFSPNSYETHQTLGDSEMVKQTSLTDFNRLQQDNLEKSQIMIYAYGGGFDDKIVEERITNFLQNRPDLEKVLKQNQSRRKIDYKIPSKFKDFTKKTIISDLAHEHCDLNLYFPLKLDFEERATFKVFDELFLKFFGQVYDILRNKKGWIYSMYSSHINHLDSLYFNLSAEKQYISQIIIEIDTIFSDFKKYFDSQKFEQLKKTIYKKFEISKDKIGADIETISNNLIEYNKAETMEDFSKKIQQVQIKDIQNIYQRIQDGLKDKKIALVSRDKEVKNLV